VSADEKSMRDRIVDILNGVGRVNEHVGEDSPEGVQADLTNLRAAVRELQHAVVELAEELDRRA
jgi:hypothetical protein